MIFKKLYSLVNYFNVLILHTLLGKKAEEALGV